MAGRGYIRLNTSYVLRTEASDREKMMEENAIEEE